MGIDTNRYEELIINALEWAINESESTTRNLIRGMGITPEELDAVGYDETNFPDMHRWALEE